MISDAVLESYDALDELTPWFDRSCEYVGSLKPKKAAT